MSNNDPDFGQFADTQLRVSINDRGDVLMDVVLPNGQPVRLRVDAEGAMATAALLAQAAYRIQGLTLTGVTIIPLEVPAPTQRTQS